MAELGLCVNAKSAMPDAFELGALGLSSGWIRTICYDFDSLDAALRGLAPGAKVCVVLNSETAGVGNDYRGWATVVGQFAATFRGRVAAVECGNEFDLLGLPDTHAARCANLAADSLHAAGMKAILASVAGPRWPEYLESSARMLGPGAADYCALHPYGQRAAGFPADWGFGELIDAVTIANQKSGLPVALTECGIKVGDAGGEAGQAEYVRRVAQLVNALPLARCPFACYFAWRDDIGGPHERGDDAFGLRREDGSARPAWQAFSAAHAGAIPVPPLPEKPPESTPARYQEGFLAWATTQPELLGVPLEDEHGGIEGFSQQLTDRGVLTWAKLEQGEVYTFYELATRKRWRWSKSLTRAVEV